MTVYHFLSQIRALAKKRLIPVSPLLVWFMILQVFSFVSVGWAEIKSDGFVNRQGRYETLYSPDSHGKDGLSGYTVDQILHAGEEKDSRFGIIIDAGHGGPDTGVVSMAGMAEKDIALGIARAISLMSDTGPHVVLIRSGDYAYPLIERAAAANRHKGRAFISIHTAGTAGRKGLWTIYYYRKEGSVADSGLHEDSLLQWGKAWQRHDKENKLLAAFVSQSLLESGMPITVEVHGAPLALLEGVDMPAVLVETPSPADPGFCKTVSDQGRRAVIARAILDGIVAFLVERRPSVESR